VAQFSTHALNLDAVEIVKVEGSGEIFRLA
jgi:hypothetical protein